MLIVVSSNLMRTMAGKVTSTWEDGSAVISTEVFTGIGNLTFEQLSSLRHRGAFSTVSLTFARCCQLTQNQISVKLLDPHILSRWHRVCFSFPLQNHYLHKIDIVRAP